MGLFMLSYLRKGGLIMNYLSETIELSKIVAVTDPCYGEPIWCNTVLDNVLPGEYHIELDKVGGCVSQLHVIHSDYKAQKLTYEFEDDLCVDSGTMGVFDAAYFFGNAKKESWYQSNVVSWCNEASYHISEGKGVISESGHGDGMYSLYVARNAEGQIVAFLIDFI